MVHASMQRTEEEGRYWCGRSREKIRHNAHTVCFEDWKRATDAEIGAGNGARRESKGAEGARASGWWLAMAPNVERGRGGQRSPTPPHNHKTVSRHLFHCNTYIGKPFKVDQQCSGRN